MSDNITSVTWNSFCNITDLLASTNLFYGFTHKIILLFLFYIKSQSNIKLKDNHNGLVETNAQSEFKSFVLFSIICSDFAFYWLN